MQTKAYFLKNETKTQKSEVKNFKRRFKGNIGLIEMWPRRMNEDREVGEQVTTRGSERAVTESKLDSFMAVLDI